MDNHCNFDNCEVVNNKLVYKYIDFDRTVFPEAYVRQKLARIRNWNVCKSWLDVKNKQFVYECAINADDVEMMAVSFDEACEDFHWTKFELLNGNQTVKWTHDFSWDEKMEKLQKKAKKAASTEK